MHKNMPKINVNPHNFWAVALPLKPNQQAPVEKVVL